MKLFLLGLVGVLLLSLGVKSYYEFDGILDPKMTQIESNPTSSQIQLPPQEPLTDNKSEIKVRPANKSMTLEASNTVVLRGPVTETSVARLQIQVQKMSLKLPKNAEIFLVLDTPGGSVFDGLDLIDYLQAIPQKVSTITLFAASMGFQMVQELGPRYITNQGTLMSHRGSLDGLGGQLDGEFETRLLMIKRKTQYMDQLAANRMGMSIEDYKKLIVNEYWVHGFDSVQEKAADEVVSVACGESLAGEVIEVFQTMFGPVRVTFAACPLIRAPLAVSLAGVAASKRAEVNFIMSKALNDKKSYVKEYIMTNKHFKYFSL